MRTTVTIDADTEHLLRQEVHRTGQSFKEVLNLAVRQALLGGSKPEFRVQPLFRAPFPAELQGRSMNRLADTLDDEETMHELAR
jgi:hypothetical protein